MIDKQNISWRTYLHANMQELADEDVRQPQDYSCGWCTSSCTNRIRK